MTQKEWTIMIYMAGDNNLSVDMAYAMEQIKEVAGNSADSPNIFVYYDGNSPSIPTLYCDFSDPLHPRYVSSHNVKEKLEKVPGKYNENAADKKSVLNFIDWCVNKVEVRDGEQVTKGRRANRYALIFSGHSLGFQDIGLFKDESSGKTMKMDDLYHVLQRAVSTESQLKQDIEGLDLEHEEKRRDTTVLLGQKIDILGFDSCVMGMLEVGYQFGYVARTMIASEGSVPSAGWTYAKLLGSLACGYGNGHSPNKVAERFVRAFIKSQDSYTVGGVSVDMAAWDLKRLTYLSREFDDLAQTLIDCFDDPESVIYRQMERVILQVHWKSQSYMYDQNVDLGDFCELLDDECGRVQQELTGDPTGLLKKVQRGCQKVLTELKNAVILSGFSGGTYQYSNGISVFFPWSRVGYEASRRNYESLFFSKDTKDKRLYWTGFLRKYLNEVSLRRAAEPTVDIVPGAKYRYISGIPFDEASFAVNASGNGATKLAGHEASKLAGHEASKLAGHEASKLAGHEASKLAGHEASKLAGHEASKLAGHEASKLAGHEASKLAGHEASKLAGHEASKLAGHEASKLAGHEASKLAGHEASKLAGHEASKLAGHEASKLAGGSDNAFFDNLKLFKNIESRWNISGFTRHCDEDD